MRHLSALTVEVEFDGEPPDLAAVPSVRRVAVDGDRDTCQVDGSTDPLLAS